MISTFFAVLPPLMTACFCSQISVQNWFTASHTELNAGKTIIILTFNFWYVLYNSGVMLQIVLKTLVSFNSKYNSISMLIIYFLIP
jgi:hypothetical protein